MKLASPHMKLKTDTRAISRSAIKAKEPALPRERCPGLTTVLAFGVATILLLYLGTTFVLASIG